MKNRKTMNQQTAKLAIFTVVAVVVAGASTSNAQITPPSGPIQTLRPTIVTVPPAGPPIVLGQPGSYILGGDVAGVAGADGIRISASYVTLDLDGHVVDGNGVGNIGINRVSGDNIAIFNGTVTRWTGNGIKVSHPSANGQFRNLRVSDNGGTGLEVGPGSTVTNCTARSNGNRGITASNDCLISNCIAGSNGNRGISAGTISSITHCLSDHNGNHGFFLTGGTISNSSASFNIGNGIGIDRGTMINCSSHNNTGNGIEGSFCSIRDCSANQNSGDGINVNDSNTVAGCRSVLNGGAGISAKFRNYIQDNMCTRNGGPGIHVTNVMNRIEGNSVTLNNVGIDVDTLVNLIVRNSASLNTTANYAIVAGNTVGPIVNSANIATDDNPHSNYEF